MRRTPTQNNCLHKYCEWLADGLRDSGQDMRLIIKVPIIPTKENVKAEIVKPIMKAMFPEIESTTKLSTTQMSKLYEAVNFATSDRLGVSAPWPSVEDMNHG